MLSWEEIVQGYIIRHSDTIKKVTEPLHSRFGITYFTYHRITNEGQYRVLVDRPDMATHYVSERLYLDDPYLRHPSNYRTGFSLLGQHGSPEILKKGFDTYETVLDADLGVIMVEKDAHGADFFGFAGRTRTSALPSLYLEHPHLLRSFAAYFKKHLAPTLQRMSEDLISLPFLKGDNYYHQDPVCPRPNHRPFLEEIGLGEVVHQASRLTPRERQCLRYLLHFNTSKETAAALSLSPRTIEFYLDNLRDKLNCSHKKALFDLATRFHQLGLL